jgi:hypothetical protein
MKREIDLMIEIHLPQAQQADGVSREIDPVEQNVFALQCPLQTQVPGVDALRLKAFARQILRHQGAEFHVVVNDQDAVHIFRCNSLILLQIQGIRCKEVSTVGCGWAIEELTNFYLD